jgi:hypothetical protein
MTIEIPAWIIQYLSVKKGQPKSERNPARWTRTCQLATQSPHGEVVTAQAARGQLIIFYPARGRASDLYASPRSTREANRRDPADPVNSANFQNCHTFHTFHTFHMVIDEIMVVQKQYMQKHVSVNELSDPECVRFYVR